MIHVIKICFRQVHMVLLSCIERRMMIPLLYLRRFPFMT